MLALFPAMVACKRCSTYLGSPSWVAAHCCLFLLQLPQLLGLLGGRVLLPAALGGLLLLSLAGCLLLALPLLPLLLLLSWCGGLLPGCRWCGCLLLL